MDKTGQLKQHPFERYSIYDLNRIAYDSNATSQSRASAKRILREREEQYEARRNSHNGKL